MRPPLKFRPFVLRGDVALAARIIERVSAHYGLVPGQLKEKTRLQVICDARHIAIYLIGQHTVLSAASISKLFGVSARGTVLYAARRVREMSALQPRLAAELAQLTGEILPS